MIFLQNVIPRTLNVKNQLLFPSFSFWDTAANAKTDRVDFNLLTNHSVIMARLLMASGWLSNVVVSLNMRPLASASGEKLGGFKWHRIHPKEILDGPLGGAPSSTLTSAARPALLHHIDTGLTRRPSQPYLAESLTYKIVLFHRVIRKSWYLWSQSSNIER